MKILVIDDQERNRVSAQELLGEEHDLTVIGSIEDVYQRYCSRYGSDSDNRWTEFDLVMTDLFMPVGEYTGAMNTRDHARPTGEIPVGLVFALSAMNAGVPVILLTDMNHHEDWVRSLMDIMIRFDQPRQGKVLAIAIDADCVPIEGRWDAEIGRIVMCDDWWKHLEPRIKDWAKAIVQSKLFE